MTCQTGENGIKDVEITVTLIYFSNFGGPLKMPLINCEFNLILTWSAYCVISSNAAANHATIHTITKAQLYIPAATLPTQDNAKLI